MAQNVIAGILMLAIGLVLIIFPKPVWRVTESWKNSTDTEPSVTYITVIRIVGAVIGIVGFSVCFL